MFLQLNEPAAVSCRLGDIPDDIQSEGLCVANAMACRLNFRGLKGTEGNE